MAENCLVMQLPAAVTDETLPLLGEFSIHFDIPAGTPRAARILQYKCASLDCKMRIVGDGYFTNSDDSSAGKEYTPSSTTALNQKVISTGSFDVYFANKSQLKSFIFTAWQQVQNFAKGSLKGLTNMTELELRGLKDNGELMNLADIDLSHVTSLAIARAGSGSATTIGTFADLSNLANTTKLILVNNPISGDLSAFADSAAFTHVEFNTIQATGDIVNFAKNTGLTTLTLVYMQGVTGTIESLLDAMAANGRTSGTIRLSFAGTSVTYNGQPMTAVKNATFTSSGWTIA